MSYVVIRRNLRTNSAEVVRGYRSHEQAAASARRRNQLARANKMTHLVYRAVCAEEV